MDIDSLVLKGKAGCFPNRHEIQSKFSVDTEPNKPLKTNCCTREEDVWPSRACQSARKGIEETVAAAATETGATRVDDKGCPRETYAQLGHTSSSRVQHLTSRGLLGSVSTKNFDCVSCQLGKQPAFPFNTSESMSINIFDLIHSNV